MMTSAECRAKAEEMAAAADAAMSEMDILQWQTMAREWQRLAATAAAQEAIQTELNREAGLPDDAPL